MTEKTLPHALTSFDILKSVAVIIMIVDHIGFYFFPQDEMWRAVGRIGFPVWFFLVGYARGREVTPGLMFGGIILLLGNMLVGMSLMPLNALFTIMAIRLMLDRYAAQTFRDVPGLLMSCGVLTLLIYMTAPIIEYGSLGFITALFGYVIRNRPVLVSNGRGQDALPWLFAVFTFVAFTVTEELVFKFALPSFVVMAIGTFLCVAVLLTFRRVTYERTAALPGPVLWLLHLGGRRTLEIYVLHLFAFKIMGAFLHPDRYHWFHAFPLAA